MEFSPLHEIVLCDFVVFLGFQLPGYLSCQNCNTYAGETFSAGVHLLTLPLGQPFPSKLQHFLWGSFPPCSQKLMLRKNLLVRCP